MTCDDEKCKFCNDKQKENEMSTAERWKEMIKEHPWTFGFGAGIFLTATVGIIAVICHCQAC